jgi:hypothetical protein
MDQVKSYEKYPFVSGDPRYREQAAQIGWIGSMPDHKQVEPSDFITRTDWDTSLGLSTTMERGKASPKVEIIPSDKESLMKPVSKLTKS